MFESSIWLMQVPSVGRMFKFKAWVSAGGRRRPNLIEMRLEDGKHFHFGLIREQGESFSCAICE